MPKTAAPAPPWPELEQQAYHAYREWPIWLVLRERELAALLRERARRPAPEAAPTDPLPEQPSRD